MPRLSNEDRMAIWEAKRDKALEYMESAGLEVGSKVEAVMYVGSHLLAGAVFEKHIGTVKLNKDGWPIFRIEGKGITFARKRAKKTFSVTVLKNFRIIS